MNLTLIQGWTCSTTRQCFQIQFRQSHWHEERPIFLEGMQVQQEYYWYPSLPKKAFSEMKGCRVLKTPPTSNHTVQKMHSKWAKSTVPLNKLSPSQRVQNNKTSIRSKRITQIFLDRYYIYYDYTYIYIYIYKLYKQTTISCFVFVQIMNLACRWHAHAVLQWPSARCHGCTSCCHSNTSWR